MNRHKLWDVDHVHPADAVLMDRLSPDVEVKEPVEQADAIK
ncbi:hypothetical protein [Dyadobacter bucti]|nr:hypothetical protein [Dyadobacter bucti]